MRTLWRFIAGFFKWTWRLLNFVREMVLNLFFIFLVLVGVGIWMQVSGGDSKETASRGALLLDISGVIVDKPDSSQRFSKLSRQLLEPVPIVCRKTHCLISSIPFARRRMTAISPVS